MCVYYFAKCRQTIPQQLLIPQGKSAGLISLINKYLDNTEVDPAARVKINKVLKFISQKASGTEVDTNW